MDRQEKTSRLLRLKEVEQRVGFAKSTIYAWIQTGTFPRPIHLGDRANRWLESEIEEWITQRVRDRR